MTTIYHNKAVNLQHAVQTNQFNQVLDLLYSLDNAEIYAIDRPILHDNIKNICKDFYYAKKIFTLLAKRPFNLHVLDSDKHTVFDILYQKSMYGHIQELCDNRREEYLYGVFKKCISTFDNVLELIATCGVLNVLEWCYDNNKQFSNNVMDYAAGAGHLHVVKWLHENGQMCTANALKWAARCGHLDVVKYVFEHYRVVNNTWSVKTIQYAIIYANDNKHQETVDYLTSVHPLRRVEKIEQEYFDTLSMKAYDNFVNDASNSNGNNVNHYNEIIKQIVATQDVDTLLLCLDLPRYENIDAIFILAKPLTSSHTRQIKEYTLKHYDELMKSYIKMMEKTEQPPNVHVLN